MSPKPRTNFGRKRSAYSAIVAATRACTPTLHDSCALSRAHVAVPKSPIEMKKRSLQSRVPNVFGPSLNDILGVLGTAANVIAHTTEQSTNAAKSFPAVLRSIARAIRLPHAPRLRGRRGGEHICNGPCAPVPRDWLRTRGENLKGYSSEHNRICLFMSRRAQSQFFFF